MLVLTTAGVQSESHLPFAALHQLLLPVLTGIDALPGPQRTAMQAAFGMTDAPAPDLFFIALAALELLAETAATTPVLLVVEDAHWLDSSSAAVVAFVARRLDPIVALIALRDGFDSPLADAGLNELVLVGLDEAAGMLLDAHAPDLSPEARERVLTEAAGNPLALLELPSALASHHLEGDSPLPEWLPLTTRLERAFAARVTGLPAATRTLLLVAAVDDGDDLAEVLAASGLIGGSAPGPEVWEPAVVARLIELDDSRIRFRHPLVRSAVYQTASVPERRSAHAALAGVLAGQPDRRVWHRAASAVGPDEALASELEVVRLVSSGAGVWGTPSPRSSVPPG
jgi:hypothetical protein